MSECPDSCDIAVTQRVIDSIFRQATIVRSADNTSAGERNANRLLDDGYALERILAKAVGSKNKWGR